MKNVFLIPVIVGCCILFMSCGEKEPLPPEPTPLAQLISGEYTGISMDSLYKELEILGLDTINLGPMIIGYDTTELVQSYTNIFLVEAKNDNAITITDMVTSEVYEFIMNKDHIYVMEVHYISFALPYWKKTFTFDPGNKKLSCTYIDWEIFGVLGHSYRHQEIQFEGVKK